jgi:hypothetical protein
LAALAASRAHSVSAARPGWIRTSSCIGSCVRAGCARPPRTFTRRLDWEIGSLRNSAALAAFIVPSLTPGGASPAPATGRGQRVNDGKADDARRSKGLSDWNCAVSVWECGGRPIFGSEVGSRNGSRTPSTTHDGINPSPAARYTILQRQWRPLFRRFCNCLVSLVVRLHGLGYAPLSA